MSFIPWTQRDLHRNSDGTMYDPNLKDWERCPKCGQCENVFFESQYYCPECKISWSKEQYPDWTDWDFYTCPEGYEHHFPTPM